MGAFIDKMTGKVVSIDAMPTSASKEIINHIEDTSVHVTEDEKDRLKNCIKTVQLIGTGSFADADANGLARLNTDRFCLSHVMETSVPVQLYADRFLPENQWGTSYYLCHGGLTGGDVIFPPSNGEYTVYKPCDKIHLNPGEMIEVSCRVLGHKRSFWQSSQILKP